MNFTDSNDLQAAEDAVFLAQFTTANSILSLKDDDGDTKRFYEASLRTLRRVLNELDESKVQMDEDAASMFLSIRRLVVIQLRFKFFIDDKTKRVEQLRLLRAPSTDNSASVINHKGTIDEAINERSEVLAFFVEQEKELAITETLNVLKNARTGYLRFFRTLKSRRALVVTEERIIVSLLENHNRKKIEAQIRKERQEIVDEFEETMGSTRNSSYFFDWFELHGFDSNDVNSTSGFLIEESCSDETLLTAAAFSVYFGHTDGLAYQISRGANMRFQTESGQSLVFLATLGGDIDVLDLLFETRASADASTRNDNNQSPLLSAIQKGRLDVAKFLVAHGAAKDLQREIKDKAWLSPLRAACKWSSPSEAHDLVSWLLTTNAYSDVAVGLEDDTSELEVDNMFFFLGVTRGRSSMTPASAALEASNFNVVLLLVEHGAWDKDQQLEVDIVHKDLANDSKEQEEGRVMGLIKYIQDFVDVHNRSFGAFLMGSASATSSPLCRFLIELDSDTSSWLKALIADFVGFPYGKRMRKLQETIQAVASFEAAVDESDEDDDEDGEDDGRDEDDQ